VEAVVLQEPSTLHAARTNPVRTNTLNADFIELEFVGFGGLDYAMANDYYGDGIEIKILDSNDKKDGWMRRFKYFLAKFLRQTGHSRLSKVSLNEVCGCVCDAKPWNECDLSQATSDSGFLTLPGQANGRTALRPLLQSPSGARRGLSHR
jgi:hypothetical protein